MGRYLNAGLVWDIFRFPHITVPHCCTRKIKMPIWLQFPPLLEIFKLDSLSIWFVLIRILTVLLVDVMTLILK